MITAEQFQKAKEGLELILNHFHPDSIIWPRRISTHATGGAQREVNSVEQAMAYFEAANLYDCRISAYPIYTDHHINTTGIRRKNEKTGFILRPYSLD